MEGVEGAARIPRPPRGWSLPGQVVVAVVAGFLAAVVEEEAPGAALVGEVGLMAGAVAMEEE